MNLVGQLSVCWKSLLNLDLIVSIYWVQNIRADLRRRYSSSDSSRGSLEAGARLRGDGSVWILAPALWDGCARRTGVKDRSAFSDRCVIFDPDAVCFPQGTTTFHRNISKTLCGPSAAADRVSTRPSPLPIAAMKLLLAVTNR